MIIQEAAHSICNLNYKVPREISLAVHNGSAYDYHFLIKELVEEFKVQLECLGENREKYITFSVPIKKEHNNGKTITYKIKFIYSCRLMQSKLSDLNDNLSEINNKDCQTGIERKNIKSECDFIGFKNNKLNYTCKECKETSTKPINGLIKKFPRMYQFCNGDLNKFVLWLRKGVYPYEDMDSWEKFDETSLPSLEDFYSKLNFEGISDEDYAHAQKVWELFEIRNRGEYHGLYVQTDALFLVDILEKIIDTCIDIYRLDPSRFLSAPGLAWQEPV